MTKLLTTKTYGFGLALATIQHNSHPVALALSLRDHTTRILHTVTQKLCNGKQSALTASTPNLGTQ